MAAALESLGWTVDLVRNGTLDQMESAVLRLKYRLSSSNNAYGFFFYAGHGVQSNGENYLIPVDASIQSESLLRQRAMPVQFMLNELNDAGNELNIVVLDACRNNPFGWSRSVSRGLAMVTGPPPVMGSQSPGNFIVYATSADSVAQDGAGRNSPFTEELLKHIKTPGLSVQEIFNRTMESVSEATDGAQNPAIYSQFSRTTTAYLGSPPSGEMFQPAPVPQPAVSQKQSGGAAIGYGAMNLALGLGSFIQGDWAGGITLLAGYGAATGLIAWELSLDYEDKLAGIPGAVGLGVGGVTALYGFIRPALYQKNRRLAGITDRVDIAIVPGNSGRKAVQLSYTLEF
jgi:hypothetical protein